MQIERKAELSCRNILEQDLTDESFDSNSQLQ